MGLKFYNNEAHFVYDDWSVTVYRRRTGDRLRGYNYDYSFNACKLVKDGAGWSITDRVDGYGQKSKAIETINNR